MKRTTILLCLLAFSACKITIDPVHLEDRGTDPSKTMGSVELSTQIVEGKNGRSQRLVAPFLSEQLSRKTWIKYRLWARKTLARPFAPDLMLEVRTEGRQPSGIHSARDRAGNKLAILSKSTKKDRMMTETVQVVLVPKSIQKNNNQDYVVILRGKVPGMKNQTYEVVLPAYYHRGFMNRYHRY